jgi:hypothetical protein
MNLEHNTDAQIVLSIALFGLLLILIGAAFGAATATPKGFIEKYGNPNTTKNDYILSKASNKTMKFLAIVYALMLPFIALLIYIMQSPIILQPCIMLNTVMILTALGLKDGYVDDFCKEYEKLYPNENKN